MSREPIRNKSTRNQRFANDLYNFSTKEQSLKSFKEKRNRMTGKYFLIALSIGFLYQTMVVKTRIYQNIIRKSTHKRLQAARMSNEILMQARNRIQQSTNHQFK